MSLHSIVKEVPGLNDEQFLLFVDLLTEAKDNESGELFLQMDEEGKADVQAIVDLKLDGAPFFENVEIKQNEEGLYAVQMVISEKAAQELQK